MDDFRNTFMFFECSSYGDGQAIITDVSISSGAMPTHQKSNDSITLFKNFTKQYETKSREEALTYLNIMVQESPTWVQKELKLFHFELDQSLRHTKFNGGAIRGKRHELKGQISKTCL